nr:hypothetical protein [Tanacetum cinerariifolium]
MIDDLDRDEGAALMSEKEEEKKAEKVKDITGDVEFEGRQAEIYQIDMDHAAKVLSIQEDETEVQEVVEVVTTAKLITKGADFPMSLLQEALDACAALTRQVEHLEHDKVAQALEIIKLKKRVKKLESADKVKVIKLRRLKKVGTSQRVELSTYTNMKDASNQGRMIDELDKDEVVALMGKKDEEKKAKEVKDIAGDEQVKGRQAEIYQIYIRSNAKYMLTQSKLVSITAVRPVSAVVPKIMVTQPRHAHSIKTKSKSPIRRHITRSPSPKTNNSPPKVTAAQDPVVSAAKGKKGKWGADFPMSLLQEALDACAALTRQVEHLEHDKVAQALEIIKLKKRVKKLESADKVKVIKLRRLKKVGTSQRVELSTYTNMKDASNQGRMIDELDKDEVVALMGKKDEEKKAKEVKDIAGDEQVKGRQAEIYQIYIRSNAKYSKTSSGRAE